MLATYDSKVSPGGSRSLTRTLVAGSGPRLARLMVKVMVSLSLGVALLTVLVMARSARCGVTVTLPLLFEASESNWSRWLRAAVLVSGLGLSTRAWMVRVWVAPLATAPTVQTP